ncbi:Mss4-like protein, partial [Ephemerocybe angulata]
GSCLCKAVRYELEGEPVWFRVCHCVNCRKVTGAAFMANVLFPAKSFRITQGEGDLRVYEDGETASGVPMQRWFCGGCGSNV